jgi:hypothetical protein
MPVLMLALGACEWSASCLLPLILCERAHGTHWIGDWADPRIGLGSVENRTLQCLHGAYVSKLKLHKQKYFQISHDAFFICHFDFGRYVA